MSQESAPPLLFPEATEGFDGIVIAMDWVAMPSGRLYKAFAGKVQVLSAEAAVGFTPTGHNSANWLARISGTSAAVTLMGCQVRAVLSGDISAFDANADTLEVP